MRLAIVGTGNVGRALGTALVRAGHQVVFGHRDPAGEKAQSAVKAAGNGATAAGIAEAARDAEVVVFATPWQATEDAVRAAGDLAGKLVIDCTNPLGPDLSLVVGHDTSAGEIVAGWAAGARVVKAFNTTGFANMADARYDGNGANGSVRPAMFVAGDDAEARSTVVRLAQDIGFEPIDSGPLKNARLLEPVASLWIWLALNGLGPDIAFALLRR